MEGFDVSEDVSVVSVLIVFATEILLLVVVQVIDDR
jgi:hypothetical protein